MRFLSLVSVLMLCGSPVSAEQVQFKIVDLLWLQHAERGEGVEIVYQFVSKPSDGDDALQAFALSECNRVAPKYVPMVLEKVGRAEPDFVAITFRFGGAFGSYIKWFADYKDGVCSNIG